MYKPATECNVEVQISLGFVVVLKTYLNGGSQNDHFENHHNHLKTQAFYRTYMLTRTNADAGVTCNSANLAF